MVKKEQKRLLAIIVTSQVTNKPNVPTREYSLKKALQATCDESNDEDREENENPYEITNMCFMAINNEVNS